MVGIFLSLIYSSNKIYLNPFPLHSLNFNISINEIQQDSAYYIAAVKKQYIVFMSCNPIKKYEFEFQEVYYERDTNILESGRFHWIIDHFNHSNDSLFCPRIICNALL